MYPTTRVACIRTITSSYAPSHALKLALIGCANGPRISPASHISHQQRCSSRRQFSTSKPALIKDFFPAPDTPDVKLSRPAWPHPIYTEEQMNNVVVAHREAKTFGDKIAFAMVRVFRWGLDFVTGYNHDKELAKAKANPNGYNRFAMDERKYMIRNVFLESVAGVPGMVAGMLRHLHSMRRMKRDNGWIETLLEESYNERMHLLVFMKMAEPGWFMRLAVLGAQGVWFNFMFVFYLLSPRTMHRFVGYLEEEATWTYTKEIEDIDNGKLKKWAEMPAPEMAVQYWNMPEGNRTVRDMLMYIRADESKHREVNHTLANLDQKNDPNPFTVEYKDDVRVHPRKDIKHNKPMGWEREEVFPEVVGKESKV